MHNQMAIMRFTHQDVHGYLLLKTEFFWEIFQVVMVQSKKPKITIPK